MKRFLFFLTAFFCVMTMFAQTSVQGVPRQFGALKQTPEVSNANQGSEYVDFDQIQFWAGEGSDKAALVIKWPKSDGTSVSLVWGYKFDGESTGLKMIEAVTKADPSLKILTQYTGIYGNTICGIGYGNMDQLSFNLAGAKADNRILFGYETSNTQMGQNIAPGINAANYAADAIIEGLEDNQGVIIHPFDKETYGYPAYDYDYWKLSSNSYPSSLWLSGWYEGYWSYWVKSSGNDSFSYSDHGASSRIIKNGYVDGWSYCNDMSSWEGSTMLGNYIYVKSDGNALGELQSLERAARLSIKKKVASKEIDESVFNTKHFNVHNMAEYYAACNEIREMGVSEVGATIEFDASLNGKTLTAPREEWIDFADAFSSISVPLRVIGNGVSIDGVDWIFYIHSNSLLQVENLTLVNCGNIVNPYDNDFIVKNCRFISCKTPFNLKCGRSSQNYVRIENCIYLRPYSSAGSSAGFGEIDAAGANFTLEVLNCTFADADVSIDKPGVSLKNSVKGDIKFINCVFDNNKYVGDNADIDVNKTGLTLGEYNVINGTVGSNIEVSESNFVGQCDPVVNVKDDIAYPLASGKAFAHFPANTLIEGVKMPVSDFLGNEIDYTFTVHSGAVQAVYKEEPSITEVDYTKGTFIVNEDWYGHQNSTVNFLTENGEWIYRVVQKENPGVELGCTNQFGTIYGNRFYLIAKQDQDPGAKVQGARITICDAKTMKVLKQIPVIAMTDEGNSDADGRGFLGVDEHKGYVGTSNGIYILDLDEMELKGSIVGSGNGTDDPYQSLYGGQIGNMVRVNERVFAVHQKLGVLVIDPSSDKVESIIEYPGKEDGWSFGTIVLSKDGNLWLSVAAINGGGKADNKIVKLDPATLELEVIELPSDVYGPGNSWYAWTPDGFCASTQNNVLYWNGGPNSWFSNKMIYKYDIDTQTVSKYLDFNDDPDGWQIYGCSFRIDPVTDEAYASLYKTFGDPTYLLRKYDNEGNMVGEYPMISNYWFPSLPVFPDNSDPEVDMLPNILISHEKTVDLSNIATDADNMQVAIVKSVKSVSDESVLSAKMENGDVVITPLSAGMSKVTIQVNSNGKLAQTYFIVQVSGTTGVNNIDSDTISPVATYSLDGKIVGGDYRGTIIIKMSNGSTRKVIR